MLERLAVPIVQAPLAGGPSTPELAAAVANAGGLGFVAAGYKTPDAFAADLAATRAQTGGPIGANLFAPGGAAADPAAVAAYAARLAPEAARAGVELGAPRFDDDAFDAKLAVLAEHPVGVVSFTFAAPPQNAVAAVHATGAAAWVTVTHPDEARRAVAAGADALVVQGVEAGGHRGSFDDGPADIALLPLLALVRAAVDVPLVATGAIATARRRDRRARRRRRRRAGRHRVHALPRGGDRAGTPRGNRRARAHRADPRVLRAPRARHREPPAARALRRRAQRLPGDQPHHGAAARPRPRDRRRRPDQPLGRPGPRARPADPAAEVVRALAP